MNATDINVKGLKELQELLDKLPAKVEANIMRGALRAGAKPIRAAAINNINSKSGELAAGIKVSTRIKGGVVSALIGTRGPSGYKANFVEYGTRAHLISVQDNEKNINYRLSRKRGVTVLESMRTINRRVLQIGRNFVGPTVDHPGAKPHPFMRPALDSEGQNAAMAAAAYIKRRLSTKHGLDVADIDIGIEQE
jgi:HK97 gp10 family phage protein